jgi:TolB-like protein
MRITTRQTLPILILVVALLPARAAQAGEPQRIWILPFEQLHPDGAVEYLREALPALLTVAITQTSDVLVVDRELLNQALEEHALTLEGLTSGDDRHRIGKLLGATVMIAGSYTRQGGELFVHLRAIDLETGVVTATTRLNGPMDQPRELIGDLYQAVLAAAQRKLPDLPPGLIDQAPWANLHFMKGLGHHFSARHNLALAEFILAAEQEELTDISRLWMAKTYMADRQYGHAYFELICLMRRGPAKLAAKEMAQLMLECERQLSADEVKRIQQLTEPRAALVGPLPASRELYRCMGDRVAMLPLSIAAAQIEALVIRADLVQRGATLALPVMRDLDVAVRVPASGAPRITSTVRLQVPAVARETDFELRFRSRRQTDEIWRPAGRIAVRVYPADPVSAMPGSPCH